MIVGVDIGGTHFRMALLNEDGEILRHERVETKTIEDPLQTLRAMKAKIDVDSRADLVVVGVPGVVDYIAGNLVFAPNIDQRWVKLLDVDHIKTSLGVDALLVNDADVAAIGEFFFGAGRGLTSMAYVTVSTGVGVGVILEGRLLRGRLSNLELGHSYIPSINSLGVDPDSLSSVEDLASGTALAKRARAVGLEMDNELLLKQASVEGSQEFELLDALSQDLSVALANLCWMTSVQELVLGGGIALNSSLLVTLVRSHLQLIAPKYLKISIQIATLGDDAGLIGAAAAKRALI